MEGFFRSGGDVTFIIGVEVDDGLLLALLDFQTFGVEALLLEFVLVDLIGVLRALPHPTDHLHVSFIIRLLVF